MGLKGRSGGECYGLAAGRKICIGGLWFWGCDEGEGAGRSEVLSSMIAELKIASKCLYLGDKRRQHGV